MNTAPRQSPQFNIQYQKEKKKKIRLKINYSGIELFRGPVELPSLDLRIAMLIYAHLLKWTDASNSSRLNYKEF